VKSRWFLISGLAVVLSCGGTKSPSQTLPRLPGDGDANTAKPKPGERATPDPWAGRTDLIQTPAAKDPVPLKLPAIQRFSLKNGLEVIVVENHELPVVGMQLAVKVGGNAESRDKRGLASFVASMLTKGTRSRTAERIADDVDFAGAQLSASATFEATFASCSAIAAELATCLRLMPDVIVNPTFPEKELKEVRDGLITSVRNRLDDPEEMAGVHFQNALWGDEHVRGWPMTAKSVNNVSRADLVAWHARWFSPQNAILVVAGDVQVGKLRPALEQAFRSWRAKEVEAAPTYPEPALQGIRVRLVNRDSSTQSQIRVGHLGIAHGDPDYYAVSVMNYVLGGGGFSSRLVDAVRVKGGKSYGANSAFDRNRTRGAFAASTFTRTEETVPTIRLVLDELKKMRASGPTEREVADAVANITGSYATRFESASDVAGALLAAELHGFDDAYLREFALKIGAVTTGQAREAAARRLDPDNAVVVVVGNAQAIAPQLDKAGWTYEVIDYRAPIAAYDRQSAAEAALVSPEDEKRARRLLDAALNAKGGEKRLRGLRSMTVEGKASIESPQGTFNADFKRVWVVDKSLRLDLALQTQMGKVDVTTVVTPEAGWTRHALGAQARLDDLRPEDLADAKVQLWRDSELVLLRHRDKGTQVRPLPEQVVDGVAYDVVQITHPDGHSAVALWLDKKTHLLARMTYADGQEEAVETFADYRPFAGIKVATSRKSRSSSGKFDSTLDSVTINPKVDPTVFAKPEPTK
jgi:zinc protease